MVSSKFSYIYDQEADGRSDRTIKVWDRESGACSQTLVGHRGSVTSLQLSDDMIVSGSGEHNLYILGIRIWLMV